jgi:hypothetical protein
VTDVSVLIVSKGHAFDHDAFLDMFSGMERVTTTLVEQPAAQVVLQPEHAERWNVVLFYDMSGLPGAGLLHDGAADTGIPPPAWVRAVEGLLDRGTGLLLMNHATVSWPLWPLWRRIHGSSFMLAAGELDGESVPGSGYRGGHGPLPAATVHLAPQGDHPVLAGLDAGFELTDELYLKTAGYEAAVLPLLRADYAFVQKNFTAPPLASPEERESWSHPPGSDLLVWANACGNAPIVVSDPGDGPLAFGNPDFRRLLENAIRWLASGDARAWARDRDGASGPLATG